MKNLINTLFFLLSSSFAFAQASSAGSDSPATERLPGEMLIQLETGADLSYTLRLLNEAGLGTVSVKRNIAPDWNMVLLAFDENRVEPSGFLAAARRTSGVRFAQWNHRVPERSTEPNDPEWWRQSDMDLIGAPEAWDATTGGLTPAGDTIVVAVLEKGALISHPDLAPNRWHNWAEIPDNDIDDDNNGYVDDHGGWDARNDGDQTGTSNHGTAVNGIVGARGNNATGVTGVNWTVKLMSISNAELESEIVAAYHYVGKMRRVYNESNGQKGAFVVATNASFGLDKEHAADHPLWCAAYDSLGLVGILGVGATTNQNTDVDFEGDMPTSCKSEFLIAVNNTNQLGAKMPSTGYGAESIDLGAPGNDTYSTATLGSNNPGYGTLGGTSAATPHVTGAVALLYSTPCNVLTSDALFDPAGCARRVRDILLGNVEPEPSLSGITTSGGYLQIGNAVAAVRELCNGLLGPLQILDIRMSPDYRKFDVYYQTPTTEKYNFRLFNMLGQLLYEETLTPQEFGFNHVEIDASQLPRAVYVVSISRGNAVVSRKIPKI